MLKANLSKTAIMTVLLNVPQGKRERFNLESLSSYNRVASLMDHLRDNDK